jgi:molybdopterin/thiamine biosynthesis adenylyltransferase
MKIVVVGVGALGSHLVPLLRNVSANIVAVDFDRIERKNVLSQFHPQNAVGKSKAVSLQQLMQFLFGSKIGAVPHRLTSLNASEILGGAELAVDCLDNGESRRVVQSFARERKIPCLHGALAGGGQFGRVAWDEQFSIDDESGAGAPTCENGEFLPFIAVVAANMAYAVQQFSLTGKKIGFQVTPAGSIRV